MGNYEQLKQSITDVIKTNGNQEITGSILQNVLLTIISAVGANATFAGVATPATNPGTPDGSVFYLASESGTYSNFGGIELQDGLSVLSWNGSWNSQQIFGIDDEPTAGSNNLVKSGGVQQELALGAVYDVSAKNPTAGPNNDGKFESLSALLEDANLNTLIPTGARKGGMSIKFIQSSDNKYVQARLMADEFTTDITQWVIADEGVYVDNPEFVYVKADSEGRILWAIKDDGSIYYGAGCPQQVKDYIEEKISSLSLDEYEDIVSFLSDYLGSDTTLKAMIDGINAQIATKVDKEEGKSLIPTQYIQEVENPEFIKAELDEEQKLLGGIKNDGTYWFNQIESPTLDNLQKEVNDSIEESQEALAEHYDYYNVSKHHTIRDVFNIYTANTGWQQIEYDSTAAMYDELDVYQIGEVCNYGEDTGHSYEAIIRQRGVAPAIVTQEYVTRRKFTLEEAISVLPAEILTAFAAGQMICFTDLDDIVEEWQISESGSWVRVNPYEIKDPEGRVEIKLDNDNKIIAYRKSDGTWVENVGIETNHLEFTKQGMTEFQQALKDAGFQLGGVGDFTDSTNLEIPTPKLAFVNFKNPNGETIFPQAKFVDFKYLMEFYDGNGNYFKKEVIFNAQGNSSMGKPKKNGAIDICNNNGWDDKDTFKLKIGDWVVQDSYHLKAFYTNMFKVEPIVGYKLADMIAKSRGIDVDRPWKKALLGGYEFTSDSDTSDQIDDISLQMDNGARCWPDGFPCIVFLDGEFYGVYMWSLKKHRDNYHMSKKKAKHIHLDGTLNPTTLFGGTIDWTAFEVRNPKNLCYQELHDGTYKYDADVAQDEIAGIDKNYDGDWVDGSYAVGRIVKVNSNYFINMIANNTATPVTSDVSGNKNTADSPDFKNKTGCGWVNCTTSVQVKQYIIDLSTRHAELNDASTDEDRETMLNKYFDVDNIIDYILFSQITSNYDGWSKNWQWTTWDGKKWFINYYDLDGLFGCNFVGTFAENASRSLIWDYTMEPLINRFSPAKYVYSLHANDVKSRYQQIRTEVGISPESVIKMINSMAAQVGENYYSQEYEKWPDSECNRDQILNEGWEIVPMAYFGTEPAYNPNTTYEVGDECWMDYRKFRATQQRHGVQPFVKLGYHDSLWRINKWLEERFSLLDAKYEYSV